MKKLHDAARDAYLLWKDSGKPRQGVAYELMRHSRSQFKHSLRVCKNRKNTIIADNNILLQQIYVRKMIELFGEK